MAQKTMLTALEIDQLLRDPQSPFSKEYNAALMISAALRRSNNKYIIAQVLENIKEREFERLKLKQKYDDQSARQKQVDEYNRKIIEIAKTHQLLHPQLLPELIRLSYHLKEWEHAEIALQAVRNQQKVLTQTWEDEQKTFAERVTQDLVSTLNHTNPESIAELQERLATRKLPMDVLDRLPHVKALYNKEVEAQLDVIKAEKHKTGQVETIDENDQITAAKQACQKTNLVNRAINLDLIALINEIRQHHDHVRQARDLNPNKRVINVISDLADHLVNVDARREAITKRNDERIENKIKEQHLTQKRQDEMQATKDSFYSIVDQLADKPGIKQILNKINPTFSNIEDRIGQAVKNR